MYFPLTIVIVMWPPTEGKRPALLRAVVTSPCKVALEVESGGADRTPEILISPVIFTPCSTVGAGRLGPVGYKLFG